MCTAHSFCVQLFTIKRNTPEVIPLKEWNIWNMEYHGNFLPTHDPPKYIRASVGVLLNFNLIYFSLVPFIASPKMFEFVCACLSSNSFFFHWWQSSFWSFMIVPFEAFKTTDIHVEPKKVCLFMHECQNNEEKKNSQS